MCQISGKKVEVSLRLFDIFERNMVFIFLTIRSISSLDASHRKKFDFLLVPLIQYGVKKIVKMTVFLFLKIPLSSVFVLTLKFPQISQNSANSCVVLLKKEQLLVLKNHDFYRK